MTSLDLRVGRQGRVAVVAVGGELDLSTATELRSCLDRVLTAGAKRIVMDLGETTFMDCAGLDAIVEIAKHLPKRNGGMAVARPSRLVDEMLAILQMDELLPTFPTVQLACAAERN